MEFRYWLEMVSAGIMATTLGAPLGDFLKWLLWQFIVIVRGKLLLGWGYVRALRNTTPGVATEPNANANTNINDFTDFELGGIVNGFTEGEASGGTSFRESSARSLIATTSS